jgi:polar amino acid transport system substrate-binding protein
LRDTSVEQLQGIRVGTLQGHHHPVISPLAAQGWLQAIAGDSDEENLQRLLAGKLDAVTLSKSRFLYFAKVMELAGRIEIVEPPLASYPRFIMLTAHHQSLLPIINRYLAKLSTDPSWDFRLSLYGLQYVWWNGAAANP